MESSILLCVATAKGLAALRAVNEAGFSLRLRVSTFKEVKVIRGYDEDIRAYAAKNHISFHSWNEIRKGGVDWLRQNRVWAIVCVGWRYMVPKDMIDALCGRVLVTHDSLLPKYRGYAPLVSALINGEQEAGVTVLLAAQEVDAGDIVYQKSFSIGPKDKISDLIQKTLPIFAEGVVQSLRDLIADRYKKFPQDHTKATFSIWRDEADLWVQWAQSARRIERTIRALGPPYMGARTWLGDEVVELLAADLAEDPFFEIRQPGKVWRLTSEGEPVVVCGKGMLLIREANIGNQSLIPLRKLRVRFGR